MSDPLASPVTPRRALICKAQLTASNNPVRPETVATAPPNAILYQKLKAHSAALTAALIIKDTDDCKRIVTASMDKTLALWRLKGGSRAADLSGAAVKAKELVRLSPTGAPIFSLAADGASPGQTHRSCQVFCGNADKKIVAWEPPDNVIQEKVVLDGHTGWVRALATDGRWLFSCGCNVMRQYDMTRAIPRHVRDVTLHRGDIQALCCAPSRVFSSGADGSIRSWSISKKGDLSECKAREKAHQGRVTAVCTHGGFLYSASWDGSLKMWDALTMELVQAVSNAHDGTRIHCLTIGIDGFLYTGGEDKLVRRWRLGTLEPPAEGDALYCHNYPVRALASGANGTLVSGDSMGELAIWATREAQRPPKSAAQTICDSL
ncbi:hypothetical protein WJX73_006692 [Symbiochloris irregularis]|uniref:Uncharacterized protein n=1 Tax=Symbiochloris irregularis TaxID=706552 RepID=A0AAW1NKG4_9CHLO